MFNMINWQDLCGHIICNFTNTISSMSNVMQVNIDRASSRSTAKARLRGVKHNLLLIIDHLDVLLKDLEKLK